MYYLIGTYCTCILPFPSRAREEPGICAPFINGPWSVHDFKNSFLLLMSDGLYEAYGTCIESRNPQEIHEGIAAIVIEEMNTRGNISEVAQATIDKVKLLLRSRPGVVPRLDDITLVINNFGHPLRGTDQIDTPIIDHQLPNFDVSSGGGEFVPEDISPWQKDPAPSTDNEVVSRMDKMNIIDQGGPSNADPIFPSPVELTQEQKSSGKFILSYIMFPLSFPYDKGLDDF